jgi:hypothetical protein
MAGPNRENGGGAAITPAAPRSAASRVRWQATSVPGWLTVTRNGRPALRQTSATSVAMVVRSSSESRAASALTPSATTPSTPAASDPSTSVRRLNRSMLPSSSNGVTRIGQTPVSNSAIVRAPPICTQPSWYVSGGQGSRSRITYRRAPVHTSPCRIAPPGPTIRSNEGWAGARATAARCRSAGGVER